MKQYSIFLTDFLRIRNWFRYQFEAKVFVALAFLLVIFLILVFEYTLAEGFFGYLSYQQEFGKLTARYSFNAGFLILFLLAVVSGVAATDNTLYKPEILRFLVSTPVSSGFLFLNRIAHVTLQSFLTVGLLLAPPLFVFGRYFPTGPDYLIRSIVVVIIFTLTSQAIGALITILLANRFGRLSVRTIMLMFGLVIFSFYIFLQIFFPSSFFLLQESKNFQMFQEKLIQLPLSSPLLPTNWLATTIVDSWSFSTLAALLLTIILVVVIFNSGKKFYIKSWQVAQEGIFLAGKGTVRKNMRSHFPTIIPSPLGTHRLVHPFGSLYINEFLAIVRSPAESFYVSFLTGLLIIIFFVGSKVPALREVSSQFLHIMYAVFLVGLSYIFMTLSARLIYPLMAKEKRTAWFLFSLPLKKEKLLIPKSLFASSLIFFSIPVGFFGGSLIGFAENLVVVFTFFFVVTVVFVSFINLFVGIIAPNFAESDNPEAVSTSGSGLVATFLSFGFIVLSGFLFYLIILETLSAFFALLLLCLVAVVILLSLFLMAQKSINQYNL